ncbi:hypothetical protein GCM10010353_53040 [Streptomyces chryseus]|nr:hypothetical protein GCM10010353_53040 [Streptomyces chryseus]
MGRDSGPGTLGPVRRPPPPVAGRTTDPVLELLMNSVASGPGPHLQHHLHQAGDEALPRHLVLVFRRFGSFEPRAGGGLVRAPAACWCARTMVESTEMAQSMVLSPR